MAVLSGKGYEFKDSTQNDKEFLFELFSTKKKCHQFQADTKEDLEEWKKAVEIGMKHIEPKLSVAEVEEEILEDGEEYEDINELANSINRAPNTAAPIETQPMTATKPPISASTRPSIPESPSPNDIYDEGFSMPAEPKKETATITDNSAVDETDGVFDDGEVYEDVGASPPSPTPSFKDKPTAMKSATELPRSSVPSHLPPRPPSPAREPQAPALPPPLPSRGPNIPAPSPADKSPELPVKKRSPKLDTNLFTEDYENLFYGIWSCIGGTADELSFDQGDIIHVLNRELDSESWWIGEKGGNIGLVPKTYLCPAYQVVA